MFTFHIRVFIYIYFFSFSKKTVMLCCQLPGKHLAIILFMQTSVPDCIMYLSGQSQQVSDRDWQEFGNGL